jgi:hypothetical protein
MRTVVLSVTLAGFLLGMPARSEELPDSAKLSRNIRKEPAYTSKQPLYGLAAFGKGGEKALWMVLDKSDAAGTTYDLLYLDVDGDSDLTGPRERLTPDKDGRFRLKDFTDPAGIQHGDLTLRAAADGEAMLALHWRRQFRIGGGYPQDPETGYMHFAPRPIDAPVLWLHGDGPFRFQRWYSAKLTIGKSDDFKVFLGQPGRGKSAFCAAQEHILPGDGLVKATLVYRDALGKEQRLVNELRERC